MFFNLEGCENLMKTYKISIDINEKNKTLSIDSCICTEDIYSKTDVWQAVRLSIRLS